MKKIRPLSLATALLILITFVYSPSAWTQDSPESKKLAQEYRDEGIKAQRHGDNETALMYFQKAVEIDPALAVAYNDIGVVYEAKGMNNQAKLAYGKAIDLDPNLPGPYYNLGSIYSKEGDFDRAIAYFKQRVLLGEWNDQWTAQARQELKSMGVKDPELRQDFLEEQLARSESGDPITGSPKGNDLDPKKRKRDARYHRMRGKQLYYMGRYEEALTELGIAEVYDPKSKETEKILEEVHRKILVQS
jgi:tetratricopeptide (TPR) repeat protein